jgi:hypothetical protein
MKKQLLALVVELAACGEATPDMSGIQSGLENVNEDLRISAVEAVMAGLVSIRL